MKTEILKERESDKNLCDAIAKGALIWAPLYSVGAATASYYLLSDGAVKDVAYSDILIHSLMVLSPFCIVAEVARWTMVNWVPLTRKLREHKEALPKLPHFVPPGLSKPMRHGHA